MDDGLEGQIAQWREYLLRRGAMGAGEVDELEDHLRTQVADLGEAGLSPDEALLVAVKRMGNLDVLSREFGPRALRALVETARPDDWDTGTG